MDAGRKASWGRVRGRVLLCAIGVLLLVAVANALSVWGKSAPPLKGKLTATAPVTPNIRLPMPAANPAGWRQVFADDFSGSKLNTGKWYVYSGKPGGDPAGWYDPHHVSVSNGMLVLSGYQDRAHQFKWTTGGIAARMSQTYGKFMVRFRFENGVGIGHAILLWPSNNTWPPEINFSEDNGSNRTRSLVTMHYRPGDRKVTDSILVDMTRWHTVGLEWRPGLLHFMMDGQTWFTVRRSTVPSVPMRLAIQTQAWPCKGTWGVCPNASTPRVVHLYVDWVVAYAPAR